MKKLAVYLLALALVLGLVACGSSSNNEGGQEGAGSASEVFDKIWNAMDDNSKFPAIGGDFDNMVDGAPGQCDISNTDMLVYNYYVPEGKVSEVDDAVTLMHMMNANTFTGAVLHVKDVKGFSDALKTNIEGTQWVCGCPDKLVIFEVSQGYVVYAFGETSIIEDFSTKVKEVYPQVNSLYEVEFSGGNW